jgi:hypothetical protein
VLHDQSQCPFCRRFMPDWGTPLPVKACNVCDRPLFLIPSLRGPGRLHILSAIDVTKIVMLPIVGGGTISFGMRGLSTDHFAATVAGALLFWGVIDVWDGTAGLKTDIDRVKKQVRQGAAVRKMSIAKSIFGLSSIVLGALGLLMLA